MTPPDNCPPEEDESLRKALCRKLGCVDFGGAGVYGESPVAFAPCGSIAFLGECGPDGTGGSSGLGVAGGVEAGEALALCAPGENLEEILDSHEFLRTGDCPGLPPPLTVIVFSEEALLVNPGLVGVGDAGTCSFAGVPLVLWTDIFVFSVDGDRSRCCGREC